MIDTARFSAAAAAEGFEPVSYTHLGPRRDPGTQERPGKDRHHRDPLYGQQLSLIHILEEKTPVGSNAPIEESTEKKTSPAGSNSPSAAPAGSSSPSAAPIEESAGAAEAASTDASTKSADAGEESAPAAPAAGDSASPASIAETADVVDSASADAGAKSAGAEERCV